MFPTGLIILLFGHIFSISSIPVKHFNQPDIPPPIFIPPESCPPGRCQSSTNFLIPLIISLVALFLVILLGGLIIWFYLRRRSRNRKETSINSTKEFTDPPPLYYDPIHTSMTERTTPA